MNNCLPRDITTDAEGGKTEPATRTQTVRRLIVLMLFTAATLDLTRCGLVMAAAQHTAPTAGLAAAALTARTAGGFRAGRRWAGWAALLIGLASGRVQHPQPLPHPRHGHLCPGNAAGRHHPGDRGADGPPGHNTGNLPGDEVMTSNEGRSAAISSSGH